MPVLTAAPAPGHATALPAVTLRPATPDDARFAADLYAATRDAELAPLGWPAAVRAAFLAQQHRARTLAYGAAYPGAEHVVVETGGRAVGRLVLDARPDHLRVVDLAVAPRAQGRGVATAVLQGVLARASAAGLPTRLTVRTDNARARALYERLGFGVVGGDGMDLQLEAPATQEVTRGAALRG